MSIQAETDAKIELLESKRRILDSQIKKLRSIRRSLADPELAKVLADESQSTARGGKRRLKLHAKTSKPTNGKRRNKAFDVVSKFFVARGNEPANPKEIREGTGLPKGRVSNLLYVKRTKDFRRVQSPDGKTSTFRLKKLPNKEVKRHEPEQVNTPSAG